MKKGLLNNPKFVIALAVGAFVVAGKNILSPMMSSDSVTSDNVIPPAGVEFFDDNTNAIKSSPDRLAPIPTLTADSSEEGQSDLRPKTQNFPHIGWIVTPERDPFRLAKEVLSDMPKEKLTPHVVDKPVADAEPQDMEVLPELVNAVVIGPAFKLAVIDGQLLKQGDGLHSGNVNVVTSKAIEYENAIGIKRTIPIEQLNLDPNTQ